MNYRILFIAVSVALILQSEAAVVVTGGSRFSWDFTLVGVSPGTASMDQFTIQYGPDLLNVNDRVLITVLAKNQAVPVYTHTSYGYGTGFNGLLWSGDWDTAFPTQEGTVVIEVVSGELDLKRVSIQLRSSAFSGSASISPAVHLVPEPASCALVLAGSVLLSRRRRPARYRSCPVP